MSYHLNWGFTVRISGEHRVPTLQDLAKSGLFPDLFQDYLSGLLDKIYYRVTKLTKIITPGNKNNGKCGYEFYILGLSGLQNKIQDFQNSLISGLSGLQNKIQDFSRS